MFSSKAVCDLTHLTSRGVAVVMLLTTVITATAVYLLVLLAPEDTATLIQSTTQQSTTQHSTQLTTSLQVNNSEAVEYTPTSQWSTLHNLPASHYYESAMRQHAMSSEQPIDPLHLQLRLGSVLQFDTSINNHLSLFHFKMGWKAWSALEYDLANHLFGISLQSDELDTNVMSRIGQLLCLRRPMFQETLIEQAQALIDAMLRNTLKIRSKPLDQLNVIQRKELALMNATMLLFQPYGNTNNTRQSQHFNDRRFSAALADMTQQWRDDDNIASLYALSLLTLNWYERNSAQSHELKLAQATIDEILHRSPQHPTAMFIALNAYDLNQHVDDREKLLCLARNYVSVCPDAFVGVQLASHLLTLLGEWQLIEDSIGNSNINSTLLYCYDRLRYHGSKDNNTIEVTECSFTLRYHQIERLHFSDLQLGKLSQAANRVPFVKQLIDSEPSYFYIEREYPHSRPETPHDYDNLIAMQQRMNARRVIQQLISINMNDSTEAWGQFIEATRRGDGIMTQQVNGGKQLKGFWLLYSEAAATLTNTLLESFVWLDNQLSNTQPIKLNSFEPQLQQIVDKLNSEFNNTFSPGTCVDQFVCKSIEMIPLQLAAIHSFQQARIQLRSMTRRSKTTTEPGSGQPSMPSSDQLQQFFTLWQKAISAAVDATIIADSRVDEFTIDSPALDILDSHLLLALVFQWIYSDATSAPAQVFVALQKHAFNVNYAFSHVQGKTHTHDSQHNQPTHVAKATITAFPSLAASLCLNANHQAANRANTILCQARSYEQMMSVAIEMTKNSTDSNNSKQAAQFQKKSLIKYRALLSMYQDADDDDTINPALYEAAQRVNSTTVATD